MLGCGSFKVTVDGRPQALNAAPNQCRTTSTALLYPCFLPVSNREPRRVETTTKRRLFMHRCLLLSVAAHRFRLPAFHPSHVDVGIIAYSRNCFQDAGIAESKIDSYVRRSVLNYYACACHSQRSSFKEMTELHLYLPCPISGCYDTFATVLAKFWLLSSFCSKGSWTGASTCFSWTGIIDVPTCRDGVTSLFVHVLHQMAPFGQARSWDPRQSKSYPVGSGTATLSASFPTARLSVYLAIY